MIAEIIVNSSVQSLNRIFEYIVPSEYEIGKNIDIGYRVLISFANRKKLEIGYIINFKESSNFKCKEISKVCEKVFSREKYEIALWMAKRYFCNLSDILKLLVPPGTSNDIDKIKIKYEKIAMLTSDFISDSQNLTYEEINKKYKIKSEKQQKIIEFLKDNIEIPINIMLDFTGCTRAIFQTLVKNNVCKTIESEVLRNPFLNKNIKKSFPVELSKEQSKVLDSIELSKYGKYLLFGVTGSGKTEIYLQIIQKCLDMGKNAIVLVPEISLTPQITDRFLSRFGRVIAILHSKLSSGERFDEWRRISRGEVRIVIGARSALFAPLENIGTIIIDEEHDNSYKSETTPKYDARDVAKEICQKNNACLIMGSATPDIKSFYEAKNSKEVKLLELKNRISSYGMPDIFIVDLRNELANGNKSVFSRILYEEINKNIQNKEQTILFLNRRGYSTFVMCRDCGYVVKCPKCDINLTYHITNNRLICHYCGFETSNPLICPSCRGKNIKYFGTGTQKIELMINKTFPNATVIRMDVDTTRTKNAHENILNKFKNDKIDILLGTQMITKGHDFSNVTLVGVLAADSSLNIGDYRAQERTFQLLTQVVGRAGRGDKKGRAIIQTYMPDEFSIISAKKQNYEEFYNKEITIREKLNFPPFCDIILAVIAGIDENKVKKDAEIFYNIFKYKFETYAPIPAPIPKINENYRYRILIKTKITEKTYDEIRLCLDNFEELKNKDCKLNFDINPNNMS